MATQPIFDPEVATQVTIASDGTVTGQVQIINGNSVMFLVSAYPSNGFGQQYDTCIVTISSSNISWAMSAAAGQNTIKVGN